MKFIVTQLIQVPGDPDSGDGTETAAVACNTLEEVFAAINQEGVVLDWSVYEVVGKRLQRRAVTFKPGNAGIEKIS